MVVSQATLTVTPSGTQVYGGSPTFSPGYSGFVLGQGPSVLGGTLAFSTTTTSSSPAGTYTGAVSATGLTSSNYAIRFAAGNMVVSQAPLTVTPSGTQVYGGSPTFSPGYSGFVLGQGPSVLSGSLTFSTTTTSSSPAGTYTGAVSATGLTSSNYAISFPAGNMVVSQATLTVTPSGTQVYGGSPTFSPAYSGFVLGQGPSVLRGTLAFSTTTTSSSHAGTYTGAVTATRLTSSNYAISFPAGNMVVSQATPTITWNTPAPIAYFTPLSGTQLNAAASWTVAGSLGAVGGTFTYTPAAGTVLTAGTHTLSATFAPADGTDYKTATASVQITVLGPGLTVIGSQLYYVGASSTSNDSITINPIGSSNTGSTGVSVQTTGGTTMYTQSFTSINILLQNGNDTVQMASTLTMSTVVTAGNGNDSITVGAGTNVVMAGAGSDTIQAGNGTNTITAGAAGSMGSIHVTVGNGANDVVTLLGNGKDTVTAGNGNNDSVSITGNGNDTVTVGNGTGDSVVMVGNGNDTITTGTGSGTVHTAGTGKYKVVLGSKGWTRI
jgi:hypothetical protein